MIEELLKEYDTIEEQRLLLCSQISSLVDNQWKIKQQLQTYFVKNKLYIPIEKAPEYLDILKEITRVVFVLKDGTIQEVCNDYGIYWNDACECLDSGVNDYGDGISYNPNTGLYFGQIRTTEDNPIVGFCDISNREDTTMIELIKKHLNEIHGENK